MNDYLETFEARGHEYNDAMSACPGAREAELNALLERLNCQAGQTIMDAPAGGGYVADGLRAAFNNQLDIICVEPSTRFAAAIQDRYRTFISPIQNVAMDATSLDGIASLAGLHHLDDKPSVYREWARLLKPNGRVAVGDVSTNTGTGEFLNNFVNQHTPGGHDGIFIAAGEFERDLRAAGFEVYEESLELVPWNFPDRTTLGHFCRTLFGIKTASADEVAASLADYVGIEINADGITQLNWQLRFASAYKK